MKRARPLGSGKVLDRLRQGLPRDPRVYQICVLGSLLALGIGALGFPVSIGRVALLLGVALAVQALLTRVFGLPRFDPRSPLISGLSMALLLRTHGEALAALAITVAIASKFLIRVRDKHVMNPTNFGLAVMMLAFDGAWVSPGQWGSAALFAFALACAGSLVIWRAERSDVTYAFLAAYLGLLFLRAAWLGDPLSIPLHQLQSGALTIFAFFMISDPKTTPDRRSARIGWAIGVAALAHFIRFRLYEPNDLIWALALAAPAVPLLDRLLPGVSYAWPKPSAPAAAPLLENPS